MNQKKGHLREPALIRRRRKRRSSIARGRWTAESRDFRITCQSHGSSPSSPEILMKNLIHISQIVQPDQLTKTHKPPGIGHIVVRTPETHRGEIHKSRRTTSSDLNTRGERDPLHVVVHISNLILGRMLIDLSRRLRGNGSIAPMIDGVLASG
jgi:hypothetical protein